MQWSRNLIVSNKYKKKIKKPHKTIHKILKKVKYLKNCSSKCFLFIFSIRIYLLQKWNIFIKCHFVVTELNKYVTMCNILHRMSTNYWNVSCQKREQQYPVNWNSLHWNDVICYVLQCLSKLYQLVLWSGFWLQTGKCIHLLNYLVRVCFVIDMYIK